MQNRANPENCRALKPMTKRKDITQSQPVNADKWERQRHAERITVQDRKTVPHLNSTMGGRYEGKELRHRGRL